MLKYYGILVILSLLLICVDSKPSRRKHRESDIFSTIEEVKEETIKEETNETLVTVLTKFNDFYTDILPELKLTLTHDCNELKDNIMKPKQELSLTSSLNCLTLDAAACAESLKAQFNQKVKEEYVKEISNFISKISDFYAAILKELPSNDPHQQGIQAFLNLITTDLPKLNSSIDLKVLDNMYKAMEVGMKPNFAGVQINDESKKLYEDLLSKHQSKKPSMEETNENKVLYINKIWNELFDDLRAVELFKRL